MTLASPDIHLRCIIIAAAVLAAPFAAAAQPFTDTVQPSRDSTAFQVRYTMNFAPDALSFGRSRGFDTVSLARCSLLTTIGAPQLPARIVRVALPAGMAVTSVRLLDARTEALPDVYRILPAQPPTPRSPRAPAASFAGPDSDIYAATQPWPAPPVECLHQSDLAGQSFAVLRVCPVQYIPGEGRLILHTHMDIALDGVPGYVCGDYLPARISAQRRDAYRRALSNMVVNPADVVLTPAPVTPPSPRGVGPGQYDYVIVTTPDWVDDFQSLAEWRMKQGLRSAIVTTDWIFNNGGYSGTNLEKLRAFVQDAHQNWGTYFFLFGADADWIPYHIRTITIPGYWTDDIPNDTWCADYDEDWSCEVAVARASVRNTTQIARLLGKIFTYEKNPPLSDYVESAVFFGFDISDPGDGYGESDKEALRATYLPAHWSFDHEYDSEPGTHKADMLAYLHAGYHLVNHNAHCNTDLMDAGYISHGDTINNNDVIPLTNGDRRSIVFAVGCYPANFPAVTSIGEAFVRTADGGGVLFFGNTRTGWGGSAEDPNHYSVLQDSLLYESIFDTSLYRSGDCFCHLKNGAFEGFDPYNLGMYCFTQMHLLGDVALAIWTAEPQALTVAHQDVLCVGSTACHVQVSTGGAPLDGATVTFVKDGDVYDVQTTAYGAADLTIAPATLGMMDITVTAPNCLPYEGQAEVRSNGDLDVDGDVDLNDFATFANCYYGPAVTVPPPGCTAEQFDTCDIDGDGDVDLGDFSTFALNFTG